MGIFQRGKSTVLVEKYKFFTVFILIKIGQKNLLKDIRDTKKAFLDCENQKLKKSNSWYFPKGVSHSF